MVKKFDEWDPFGEERFSHHLDDYLELLKTLEYVEHPLLLDGNLRYINFYINHQKEGILHFFIVEINEEIILVCDGFKWDKLSYNSSMVVVKNCTEEELIDKISNIITTSYRIKL